MENRKKICAITMVRNDDFFLEKWVEYYGRELGKENLYIFFDGTDQAVQPWCEGTHTTLVEKIPGQVVAAEKGRLDLLSAKAAELLQTYDAVIGVDADEFVIPDPKCGKGLAEFISELDGYSSVSGLGIDMGQNLNCETVVTGDKSFLSQRRYGLIGTRYTKPSIIFKPVRWGRGFHRIKGHNFHIIPNLFLFHFGYFDLKRIEDRFQDKDRAAAGWTKHLKKRSRTIRVVTKKEAKDWDKWTNIARNIQTWVRLPYAWNKPAMFNLDIVVKVPERFINIV